MVWAGMVKSTGLKEHSIHDTVRILRTQFCLTYLILQISQDCLYDNSTDPAAGSEFRHLRSCYSKTWHYV